MKLMDAHVHLGDSHFRETIKSVIERAKGCGVEKMVAIALSQEEMEFCLTLQRQYPGIAVAAAIHPNEVEKADGSFFEQLMEYPLQAIGETGLDFFRSPPTDTQFQSLKKHIELAKKRNLPLLVHLRSSETRSAVKDFFSVMDEALFSLPLVLHCFSGTVDEGREAVKRGYFLSFSGNITYPKNSDLRKVVEETPLEQILLETDAPFLAPQPLRGKTNEPSFIVHTAEKMAEIKKISMEKVAEATFQNGEKIFLF